MSMPSGALLSCRRAVLASKYACLHSNTKSDLASGERAEGTVVTMLDCQSRQVPMKSKRTALMQPFEVVRCFNMVVGVCSATRK